MADVVLDLPHVRGRHRNRALAKARHNRCVQLAAQGWTYEAIKNELGWPTAARRGAMSRRPSLSSRASPGLGCATWHLAVWTPS